MLFHHVAKSIGHKCPSYEERANRGAGFDGIARVAALLLEAALVSQPVLRMAASGMSPAKRARIEDSMPAASSPDSASSSSRLACSR